MTRITTPHEIRDVWSRSSPPKSVQDNFVRRSEVTMTDFFMKTFHADDSVVFSWYEPKTLGGSSIEVPILHGVIPRTELDFFHELA